MGEIKHSPNVIWDRVDGVPSFCHTEKAEFFKMNAVGNLIWEMSDGATLDKIVDQLSEIFPGESREHLMTEVSRFIQRLDEFELIERVEC